MTAHTTPQIHIQTEENFETIEPLLDVAMLGIGVNGVSRLSPPLRTLDGVPLFDVADRLPTSDDMLFGIRSDESPEENAEAEIAALATHISARVECDGAVAEERARAIVEDLMPYWRVAKEALDHVNDVLLCGWGDSADLGDAATSLETANRLANSIDEAEHTKPALAWVREQFWLRFSPKAGWTGTLPAAVTTVRPRHRGLDPAGLEQLAQSIAVVGMIQPISVTVGGTLVTGRHRREVHLRTGEPILVVIRPAHALLNELEELDENLCRVPLTVLEIGEHIERRDAILAEMGLRAKRGGQPGNRNAARDESDNPSDSTSGSLRTTSDIASSMNKSARTIQRIQASVEQLVQEARDHLRGTKTANSRASLMRVGELSPPQQVAVSKMVSDGAALTAAIREVRGEEAPTVDPAVEQLGMMGLPVAHARKARRVREHLVSNPVALTRFATQIARLAGLRVTPAPKVVAAPILLGPFPSVVTGRPTIITIGKIDGHQTANPKLGDGFATGLVLDLELAPREAQRQGYDVSVCAECPQAPWDTEGNIIGGCTENTLWNSITGVWDIAREAIAGTRDDFIRVSPIEAGRLLRGKSLRLPIYGDLGSLPFEVIEPLLTLPNTLAYTHRWFDPTLDVRIMEHAMASTETVTASLLAGRRGLRWYRIREPGAPTIRGLEMRCPYDQSKPKKAGGKPQRGKRVVTCADCLLCDGSVGFRGNGNRLSLTVQAHGNRDQHWKWAENDIEERVAYTILANGDLLAAMAWCEERIDAEHAAVLGGRGPFASWVAERRCARLRTVLSALLEDQEIQERVVAYYAEMKTLGLGGGNAAGCCPTGC